MAEFPQGAGLLHAHFIHTPASVADYAAGIMRMGWSVSAHAKDIWTSPDWELAGKLARAKWAVTCTDSGHKHLQSLAADPARVHLSYHGLNLDRFPPFTGDRGARDGSRPDAPVRIVSVGRAVPKKGYDVLLHALARLPADLHWRFDHLGGGDKSGLQALAASLGLADRITWAGSVDQGQVLAAYGASDLFALACRITPDGDRDGLPNVLVEAASQSLACVTTNISGIPELFRDGHNGWLVPPDDPASLALALQQAITRPDLRDTRGHAGRSTGAGDIGFSHIGRATGRAVQGGRMTAPKVLFYVQHLLGIGHLARASRVARAMIARGMAVTLVTGGMPVPGFPGADIPHVALPPIAVRDGAFKGLVTADGTPADTAFLEARTAMLLDTYHRLQPDIVMVEAFPFGRRQVRFELLPLIDAIEATSPRPLLVSSLRDILQRRGRPDRDMETVDQVRNHFDLVLVHGDPSFASLGDSFPYADLIAGKVAYSGLVVPAPPPPAVENFDVLVSAGGGAVGRDLVTAAVAAAALMPDLARWCVITGPNLAQGSYDHLAATAPPNVRLERFRPDLASLMSGAGLSVSQAGYNTVGDILQAGCRALLVPYTAQGETEQADRAERLAALGRVSVLADTDLTAERLAQAIRAAIAQPLSRNALAIAVDGAAQSAEILLSLVTKARDQM